MIAICELQFHLLPTRDWNIQWGVNQMQIKILQFHLLPTRDWNLNNQLK